MLSRYITGKIKPPRQSKITVCDPQKLWLVKAEREFCGVSVEHTASRDHLHDILNHASRYYHIKPVVIKLYEKKNKEYGYIICTDREIGLNTLEDGVNAATLLHELAHMICWDTYGSGIEDHGPEFVAILAHLFDKYRVIPEDCFRLICKRWSVKVGPAGSPGELKCLR